MFEKEKQLLKAAFGDVIIEIEHVGSTSIPGIPAKPILDMNIGVGSLEATLEMKDKFVALGYEHHPFVPEESFQGLREQELYVRGPQEKRTHFAHVTVYGSDFWARSILFRDYLLIHADRAQEYADLKSALADAHAADRIAYTKAKTQFVLETLELARKESDAGEPGM